MTLWLCDLRQGSILSESPSPRAQMGIVMCPSQSFYKAQRSDISAVLGTMLSLQGVLGGRHPQVCCCPDVLPGSVLTAKPLLMLWAPSGGLASPQRLLPVPRGLAQAPAPL